MPASVPTLLRGGRPVVQVGGREIPTLTGGLLAMQIVETTNGLYRCEATFGNWGTVNGEINYLYFDRSLLEFGKPFQVTFEGESLFEGKIMGLEARFPDTRSPEITVLADDRFQEFRMTRRTRSFSNLSDSDAIRRIAAEHGLIPSVDVNGPRHRVLAQVNQSDLAFLRERCRAVDAELWMEGSTLNAKARGRRNAGGISMRYGRELYDANILADLSSQRTSVAVTGWDVSTKKALKYVAGDSALFSELRGGSSGASVLSSAFGSRKESYVHMVPLSTGEAQAEAEAFFCMAARRFLSGRATAQADGRIHVGTHVDLEGLGPLFSGDYYVAEVRHLFDGTRGIRTEFMVERPGLGKG